MGACYSVSQINGFIADLFNYDSTLRSVSVCGEISNCKYHVSGHIYFTIKDAASQLSCVMFAGKRAGLSFKLEEGLSVIVTGSITVYEKAGSYQLYAERIEEEGRGKLFEEFSQLKEKLRNEGLFDEVYKQPIPKYIKTLGVITASTGAALWDIVNITKRRNPYIKIIVCPAKVQGKGAAESLIKAVKKMEEVRPDVIIIGRGGGSQEDLFEFNNEELARTIFYCSVPIISAVGHEVDFSISDFVADLRASTPSAAAELAVFEYNSFENRMDDYTERLSDCLHRKILLQKQQLHNRSSRLESLAPENRLKLIKVRLAKNSDALAAAFSGKLNAVRSKMLLSTERLNRLSPLNSLSRGYSYITNEKGHNIKTTAQVNCGDRLVISMIDGSINATVSSKQGENSNGREKENS